MLNGTLQSLGEQLERIIIAGALARDDESFCSLRDTIAAAAGRIPALAKLAEQIGKVVDAPAAAQTARESLDLAVMLDQARGALAQPGATDGELAALPQLPPIGTPLPLYEVEPLYFGLLKGMRARTKVALGKTEIPKLIKDAMARDIVCDLRLISAWIHVAFTYGAKFKVTEQVLSRLLGDLRSEGALEALRWTCDPALHEHKALFDQLVQAGGPRLPLLLLRAAEHGHEFVRGSAIIKYAQLDAQRGEELALRMLQSDSLSARQGAVMALGNLKTEVAMRGLFAALADPLHDVVWKVALVLKTFPRPDLIARLHDFIAAQTANGDRSKYGSAVYAIWRRFTEAREDVRTLPFLVELWRSSSHPQFRPYAGNLLLEYEREDLVELVADGLDWNSNLGIRSHYLTVDLIAYVAVKAIFKMDAQSAYERLARCFDRAWLAQQQTCFMTGYVVDRLAKTAGEIDPRWFDRCVELLDGDPQLLELRFGGSVGFDLFSETQSNRYVDYPQRLFELLLYCLGGLRDTRVLPVLLRMLQSPPAISNPFLRISTLCRVFTHIRDRSVAAPLRAWAQQLRKDDLDIRHGINLINQTLVYFGAEPIELKEG